MSLNRLYLNLNTLGDNLKVQFLLVDMLVIHTFFETVVSDWNYEADMTLVSDRRELQ